MSGRYAATTEVPPERTRAEIERALERYGVTGFAYGRQGGRSLLMFEAHGRRVRFVIDLPDPEADEFKFTPTSQMRSASSRQNAYEQAVRQRWRALLLVVKAKLEAIETGLESFEDAFLAQMVLPSGGTVGEWLGPQIEQAYQTGRMPAMLPGLDPAVIALPDRSGR